MANENQSQQNIQETAGSLSAAQQQYATRTNDAYKESINLLNKMNKLLDDSVSKTQSFEKSNINIKKIQQEREKIGRKSENLLKEINRYSTAEKDSAIVYLSNIKERKKLEDDIIKRKQTSQSLITSTGKDLQQELTTLNDTIEAEEARLKNQKEQLDLIAKIQSQEGLKERIDLIGEELDLEKKIKDQLGPIGAGLKLLNKYLLFGKDMYGKMVEEAREGDNTTKKWVATVALLGAGLYAAGKAVSSGLKTVGNLASQGMSSLTGTGGPIASFVSPFTNLIKQIPLVGGLIGGVADMFANLADFATDASSQSELLARNLNLSAGSGAALNAAYSNAAHASGDLLFNSKKFRDVQIEIAEATGLNNLLSTKDLQTQVQLKELHQVDLETRKELTNVERTSGVQQDRIVKSVMGTTSYLSKTLGVSFKWQSILKEVTSLSGYLGLTFAQYPEKLTKAVLTTKAMGLELSKLDGMADSFLDFESSISKEFEAQLITGKNINLTKAREAFLNNNLVEAAKEITTQVGSSAEFTKMKRIEQEVLAAAMGMSRNEMADMLKQQMLFSKLGATSLEDYQKKVSVMSQTIEGQKELVALLGQEEYSRQMNQTATEKIAGFIDKIRQSFADLLGNSSFKSFIDKIITFISDPKQIENLLSKITGFISTMIRAVATVLDGLDQLPFVDIDRGIISSIRGYADELSSAKIGALSTAGVSVGANQANSTVASSKGAASSADSGRMPAGKPTIIFTDNSTIDPYTAQKNKDIVITSVDYDGVTGQLKSQT